MQHERITKLALVHTVNGANHNPIRSGLGRFKAFVRHTIGVCVVRAVVGGIAGIGDLTGRVICLEYPADRTDAQTQLRHAPAGHRNAQCSAIEIGRVAVGDGDLVETAGLHNLRSGLTIEGHQFAVVVGKFIDVAHRACQRDVRYTGLRL